MEEPVALEVVAEILSKYGISPIRTIAWKVVVHEIQKSLPPHLAPAEVELGNQMRRLIRSLVDNGISKRMLASVLEGITAELHSERHKDQQERAKHA